MTAFHLRRDENETWTWALVEDEGDGRRVLAAGASASPTKGECINAIEQFRRSVADATTTIDTTLPQVGGRWRKIDKEGVVGGPSQAESGEYDEGETGPPEVDGDTMRASTPAEDHEERRVTGLPREEQLRRIDAGDPPDAA